MAFLLLFFTVALSLCVVGLVVLALASILGSVRDDWKIKNPNENRVRETTDFGDYCRPPILFGLATEALPRQTKAAGSGEGA